MRQTRGQIKAIQSSSMGQKPVAVAEPVFLEKPYDDVMIKSLARSSHLCSKLVIKVKIELHQGDLVEPSWSEFVDNHPALVTSLGIATIIDKLTIVIGEFNFKGFMRNYFKDLLNHYKIELESRNTAQCRFGVY